MQAGRSSYSERGGGIPNAAAIGIAKVLRLCMAALAAATLGACAQTTGNNRSAALAVHRQAVANYEAVPETRPVRPSRTAWSIIHRRVAMKKRFHRVATDKKPAAEPENRKHGVASFYSQGTQTANGEKFDPGEFTAAHRTLPFGTRLRVTNVATGQSVTVRINDRGPFVAGRDVDLSHSAAETLGIVHRGTAKVKLDVVE